MRWNDVTIQWNEYKSQTIENVHMDVPRCAWVACTGESGLGKSVTAALRLGILPHTAKVIKGNVEFSDGKRYMQHEMGWIPQNIFSCLPPMVPLQKVLQTLRLEISTFVRWAEMLHLDGEAILYKTPEQCSGGMIQRAVIALTFARRTPWIIADEATSALDEANRFAVIQAFEKYMLQEKAGVLWITHRLNEVCGKATKRYEFYQSAEDVVSVSCEA